MVSVATIALAGLIIRHRPNDKGLVRRAGFSILAAGTTIYEITEENNDGRRIQA
jgi:hypothetical protein